MKPVALFYYTVQITQGYLDAIASLVDERQYAIQHKAYCFYSNIAAYYGQDSKGKTYGIKNAYYIGSNRFEVNENYTINNLYRSRFTLIEQKNIGIPTKPAQFADTSRYSVHNVVGSNNIEYLDPVDKNVTTRSSTLYGSLKFKIRNVYGQLHQIRQIPISVCLHPAPQIGQTASTNYQVFGGDNYVGRYTKKNTFFFFYDWLSKEPDGFEFDYRKYVMIPYPRYWINTEKYNTGQLIDNLFNGLGCINPDNNDNENDSFIQNLINPFNDETYQDAFPSDNASLIRDQGKCSSLGSPCSEKDAVFRIDGWFNLFYSGLKDFFVESEINLAFRDHDDKIETRHYDKYNQYVNVDDMFDSNIIKETDYYKYDQSLSYDRFYNIYSTFGILQPRWYDPSVAETCYTYLPNRLIYSMQGIKETIKDYWRYFLTNNYQDRIL